MPKQPGLGQAKARIQELQLGLPGGWQATKSLLDHLQLLYQCISRKLDRKLNSQKSKWHSCMENRYPKWFHRISHNTGPSFYVLNGNQYFHSYVRYRFTKKKDKVLIKKKDFHFVFTENNNSNKGKICHLPLH